MSIWFAMVIPVLMAGLLMILYHHKTKVWEIAIPLVISAMMIAGFKVMAEHGATRDSEYWGAWVTSAHYYEAWNEYIHKTCSTTTCSGSGKNQVCTTSYYDCSYVQYHSEYWTVRDSNEDVHRIDTAAYTHFVQLFEMDPQFVDMKRNYHTNDGDMYQVIWPKTEATVEPVSTVHTYENRVQASRSVFSYVKVREEEATSLGLFDYPEVTLFNYPAILGDCGSTTKVGNEKLKYYNAVLGRSKELRIWFLCFPSADPQVGEMQEAYWIGGNKNEVVVTVGLDKSGEIHWVHPFSWTDNKQPLIEIRDFLVAQKKLQLDTAAGFIGETLRKEFERKHFADFSYLTVEPPTWAIVVTYVVTLLVNLGLSFWIINNDFHEGKHATTLREIFDNLRGRRRYRRWSY